MARNLLFGAAMFVALVSTEPHFVRCLEQSGASRRLREMPPEMTLVDSVPAHAGVIELWLRGHDNVVAANLTEGRL